MMNKLKTQFFAGLVIFVPLSLTIYFFLFLYRLISQTLFPLLIHQEWIELPPGWIRLLSFILTVILIWSLGLIASNMIGQRFLSAFEKGIHQIPFFRGLYVAIQKVTEAFFGANAMYQAVVLVEYPRKGVYAFGFVTSHVAGRPFHLEEPYLCVFVPTVPNPTSGMLLYVPESETISLALSIEEAVKILVSHGFVPLSEEAVRRKEKHV